MLITETVTNVQGKETTFILDVNASRDSLSAIPKIDGIKGDNPYGIPEDKNIRKPNLSKLKEPPVKEKKIKHAVGDKDYLKREMNRECKESGFSCTRCNLL